MYMDIEIKDIECSNGGSLAADLGTIIERSKNVAYRAVDVVLVYRNWLIGKRIAEEELHGELRAEYGKETMTKLAEQLTYKYGAGFDFGSLYKYLAFFKRFKILDSLHPKSGGLLSSWVKITESANLVENRRRCRQIRLTIAGRL